MADYSDLNQRTYDWCARAFEQVRKVLGVRIKMHHEREQIDHGEIFLFNHFARMETFIPQYLIYQEGGHFCRSIASAEFFVRDDRFARLLRDLGVVPNNQPNLMAMLARDVLRGRKIVVFPEGGMVKDRQVVDARGRYSVYSRHAQTRRKHHSGAARLATGLQIFRYAVQYRAGRNDHTLLDRWAHDLGMANVEQLLAAAARPVTIVPANITFYPLRISDNILRRSAELLTGGLSKRAVDELVVEGNILLKATDMDINLGSNLRIEDTFSWYERPLLRYLARELVDLPSVFDLEFLQRRLVRRVATYGTHTAINRIRDQYMRAIYQAAAVNLSHLASSIILAQVERGVMTLPEETFRTTLYLAIKRLQAHSEVRLHRGLCDPQRYQPVLAAAPSALSEFLDSAQSAALITRADGTLVFKEKLVQEHGFDEIRLENPVEVYANEVAPLPAVAAAVTRAVTEAGGVTRRQLALEFFDDELKALAWDQALYRQREHFAINQRETASADPSPFLLQPAQPRRLGVVLVHGFLASPAEVRAFGDKLCAAGYTVLGVRLKGHGTSPWDLREQSWQDWLGAVKRGSDIIGALAQRYVMVGFSTGGSLSLIEAAAGAPALAGTVAVSSPLKFRNKNLRFVPLMHGANRIVSWLSSYEGVMPFRPNESEHPQINYRNIPLRALYELTKVVAQLKKVLAAIRCPVCVIQGDGDSVVDPQSATLIYDKIVSATRELHWVPSQRHGILHEDIGQTQALVLDFLARLERAEASR